jgi:hypothetical protein
MSTYPESFWSTAPRSSSFWNTTAGLCRPKKRHSRNRRSRNKSAKRRKIGERASRRNTRSLIRELPAAFDFQVIGEDVVNGRPAYVLQAIPRPGYQPHGKFGRIFSKVEGRLWVDKQDLGWVKIQGQVIQPFSLGVFLARLQRGSHIAMEQTRLADGIWMPERIEVLAAAKLLFVRGLVIDGVLTYSDCRLGQTDLSAASRLDK